jgi:hypothetical protein
MEDKFITEFNRIKTSIEEGKTPVSSELRIAKTNLMELVPSLLIQSIFLIISTLIVASIQVEPIVQTVILLVANTTSQTLSWAVLVSLKHFIRVSILKKYGLEVNERNIAVLESM